MEFLYDYLGFFAKTATVVVAAIVVITAISAAGAHRAMRHRRATGHVEVQRFNDKLRDMGRVLEEASLPHSVAKKRRKQEAKAEKARRKAQKREQKKSQQEGDPQKDDEKPRRRVFVLDFKGDIGAHAVDALRLEVTAVLAAAAEGDEVVVRVESAGGTVHGYGLAASQLARVRSAGHTLTSVVDKVAASGGYLMAAVADRVLAAPFAVVGSIGVVAQIPNVHRLLKKHDVDVEVLTAGRHKRTLDIFGENTPEGREKLQEELHDVHALFQEYVRDWRPSLDIDAVSTGEAWYGQRALDRALVDEIATSDEYLVRACEDADVFEVSWEEPKRPVERLMGQFATGLGQAADRLLARILGGIR